MTPQQFHDAYFATAQQVSVGTGIDPIALLAQWANETDWGAVVVGNNLGNIRCSPTSFCQYATLSDFGIACIATFRNGYYQAVLSAHNALDQLAAICASPWSSGHYGGSLAAFYTPLEGYDLTPDEHYALVDTQNRVANTVQPALVRIEADLAALKTQIAALPTAGGALTAAQAQEISDTLAGVQQANAALKAGLKAS